MKRQPRRHVAIIGGGASGVLLACHLLRDGLSPLRVTLIEKRSRVGRGIAYGTANPNHLLNVRAENMSAFPDRPDHFWRWFVARRPTYDGALALPNCGDPFCFVPRRIYGDYIADLIEPLLAVDGHTGLHIVEGECVSLGETQSGIAVALADGRTLTADTAVLATGHGPPPPLPECYVDPWLAYADAGIDKDARVLILGTGLTMVDYVLTLVLAGHRGPIVAMSRRGLLPRAHRRVKPQQIDEADLPIGSGQTALLRWIRRRVDAEVKQGGDWRTVLDGLRPHTQRIWQSFSFDDRRRFLEHGRAWWDVHRHRMAPEVETRITSVIASGQLSVVAGKITAIEPTGSGALVRYRRRGISAADTVHVAKIAECRGAVPISTASNNPVLRCLFDDGLARPDALGIGIDVTPECAVIDRHGAADDRLFAIGPLTRAAFWEIMAIPDIRVQCARLAAHIIAGHSHSGLTINGMPAGSSPLAARPVTGL